jgi:hypothetical protein
LRLLMPASSLALSRSLLEEHMESVLTEFRNGMKGIVCASDEELVNRSIASIAAGLRHGKEVSTQSA